MGMVVQEGKNCDEEGENLEKRKLYSSDWRAYRWYRVQVYSTVKNMLDFYTVVSQLISSELGAWSYIRFFYWVW
jgi:hypothetical protein